MRRSKAYDRAAAHGRVFQACVDRAPSHPFPPAGNRDSISKTAELGSALVRAPSWYPDELLFPESGLKQAFIPLTAQRAGAVVPLLESSRRHPYARRSSPQGERLEGLPCPGRLLINLHGTVALTARVLSF